MIRTSRQLRPTRRRFGMFDQLEQRSMLAAFVNAGFETPVQPAAQFEQQSGTGGGTLAGAVWTFSNSGGISRNGSGFQGGGILAPEGQQIGLIQSNGTIQQTGSGFVPGQQYSLTIARSLRAGNAGTEMRVFMDDALIYRAPVNVVGFSDITTLTFTPATANPVLRIQAIPLPGDNTLFVDNIRINEVGPAPAGQLNAPAVNNPSFEFGPTDYGFPQYGPVFNWASTITNSGTNDVGGPFNNGASIPDGSRVGFIQSAGELRNVISGLVPGESYVVDYFENARNSAQPQVSVLVDGNVVEPQHAVVRPASNAYIHRQSAPFVATSSTAVLVLRNSEAGFDNTALFDNITVRRVSPIVANGGFESPDIGNFAEQTNPTGWTQGVALPGAHPAAGGGLVNNGSAYGNANAPEGTQAGLLKSAAFMEQVVSGFEVGAVYSVAYYVSPRPGQSNNLIVKANGATIQPATTISAAGYDLRTTNTFVATATSMTIRFETTDTADNSLFIDDVQINLINDAPIAVPGGPYAVTEGQSFALNGSGYDTDGDSITSYAWDLNNDGIFGDATGANPTVTWSQLVNLGVDDNGVYPIALRVIANGAAGISSGTLTVNNAAPTNVVITPPDNGAPGQAIDFTFQLIDPSPVDANNPDQNPDVLATFAIDWDDDGITDETVQGPANGTTVSHVFDSIGTKTIRALGTDKDGASTAVAATASVEITNVYTDADGNLVVGGSTGPDRILLSFSGGVQVRMNNRVLGSFSANEKVIVFGGEGADTITVGGSFPLSVEIYGGAGNDYLSGGVKADILDGGDDNDRIFGGGGDDTLIGGDGNDTLSGGNGHDNLDGGAGNDMLKGDNGNDVVIDDLGNDRLNGGAGNDVLIGGQDKDILDGGSGHDVLSGGDGSDKLYGRAGNDLLLGGLAADTIYGGTGDDVIVGDPTDIDNDPDTLALVMEILTMEGSSGDFSAYLNDSSIFPLTPDVIFGESGADRIIGADGDVIKGRTSADIVDFFNL